MQDMPALMHPERRTSERYRCGAVASTKSSTADHGRLSLWRGSGMASVLAKDEAAGQAVKSGLSCAAPHAALPSPRSPRPPAFAAGDPLKGAAPPAHGWGRLERVAPRPPDGHQALQRVFAVLLVPRHAVVAPRSQLLLCSRGGGGANFAGRGHHPGAKCAPLQTRQQGSCSIQPGISSLSNKTLHGTLAVPMPCDRLT